MKQHVTKQKNKFIMDSIEKKVRNIKILEVEQEDLIRESQSTGICENFLMTIKEYFQEIKISVSNKNPINADGSVSTSICDSVYD